MEESVATSVSRTSSAEAKWRAIVTEQKASGLSVKAFCVTRGVSAASLFAWRRRLRPAEDAVAGPPVSFVEVAPGAAGLLPAPHDERASLELELRDRRRVLILRRGFDVKLLHDVLTALQGEAS